MIGRGDFNYPFGQTQLGYNMFAASVGADYKLEPDLRVRGEYDFQKWASFPSRGLTPEIVTICVACHFACGSRYN